MLRTVFITFLELCGNLSSLPLLFHRIADLFHPRWDIIWKYTYRPPVQVEMTQTMFQLSKEKIPEYPCSFFIYSLSLSLWKKASKTSQCELGRWLYYCDSSSVSYGKLILLGPNVCTVCFNLDWLGWSPIFCFCSLQYVNILWQLPWLTAALSFGKDSYNSHRTLQNSSILKNNTLVYWLLTALAPNTSFMRNIKKLICLSSSRYPSIPLLSTFWEFFCFIYIYIYIYIYIVLFISVGSVNCLWTACFNNWKQHQFSTSL